MMRRSIFTFLLAAVVGVAFALSGDGEKKTGKSTTEKKEAGSCCMHGAKAEKAGVKADAKAPAAKAVTETKAVHKGHKGGDGNLAEAKDNCDDADCCEKEAAGVESEKKDEKKPLR